MIENKEEHSYDDADRIGFYKKYLSCTPIVLDKNKDHINQKIIKSRQGKFVIDETYLEIDSTTLYSFPTEIVFLNRQKTYEKIA